MKYSTIVVTGASGFVGSKLISYLVDKNFFVYAISYDSCGNSINVSNKIAFVKCNYLDITFLSKILSYTSCVVHLAGRAHHTHERNKNLTSVYYAANVIPIKNILTAASDHPNLKIIYLSSIAVYGKVKGFISLDDLTLPSTPYGLSKLEAENVLLSSSNPKIRHIILRSPLIFGLDAPGNFKSLILLAKYSPLLPFGNLMQKKSMIHIISVLEIILVCITRDSLNNKIYLISEPRTFSTSEILSSLLEYFNRSPNILFKVPVQFIYFLATCLGLKALYLKISDQLEVDSRLLHQEYSWPSRSLGSYYSNE